MTLPETLPQAVGARQNLTALPYWDYNLEAAMRDPRTSLIWSDGYFGPSEGDAAIIDITPIIAGILDQNLVRHHTTCNTF